jgi:hypothetical protein
LGRHSLKYNSDNKFDADLNYGRFHEKKFFETINLPISKVEIKAERNWWDKTGNILVEVERNGKPTGISVTKSKLWVICFTKAKRQYFSIIFKTRDLKKLTHKYKDNFRWCGDGKQTKGILIPFKAIIHDITQVA